jgi:hypothetical protein
MVIMRIHYAWKEYFAVEQSGDFLWQQRWDSKGRGTILCHNFPYDIYSVKGSCGPHAQVQSRRRRFFSTGISVTVPDFLKATRCNLATLSQ